MANYHILIEFIIGMISRLLLWFFRHDLAHLIVGIRFSHFYIGLSNLVNALNLDPKIKLLFIALGLKIDRDNSIASKNGYAVMYLAGPIVSMLLSLYTPIHMFLNGYYISSYIILIISIINIILDVKLIYKHGCIMKARRVLWR